MATQSKARAYDSLEEIPKEELCLIFTAINHFLMNFTSGSVGSYTLLRTLHRHQYFIITSKCLKEIIQASNHFAYSLNNDGELTTVKSHQESIDMYKN